MRIPFALFLAAMSVPPSALSARGGDLVLPAGPVADAAIVLARATGSSIVISDPDLARRAVPRITCAENPERAVRQLAAAAGARAVRVGTRAWRLEGVRKAKVTFVRKREAAPPPPPSLGDNPPSLTGEPIVVVASKRDQTLGEMPAQVAMLDGIALERGGVGGTEKITQRVATVSSTYLGSGRNKLFIRGIADSSFTGPTQATVGQYFGDLRLSYNAPDPDLRLSDLEKVEVLEGPQGTLYGAGSLGGIIRLVPRSPVREETSLSVASGGSVIQHGEPGADMHATANLGTAGAAFRVNLDSTTLGGFIDKPALARRDVNRTDILGGRAALQVDLGPRWTLDLVALGQRTRAEDSQYAARGGDPLESAAQVREGASADYKQGQAILAGRIGDVRFRSSSGIVWHDLAERYDATARDGPARLFVQQNDTRMIANETRLWTPLGERTGWVAGFSFTDNRTRLSRSLGPIDAVARTTGVTNTVLELTGYGEASLRLGGPFITTAGLRVTHARLGGEGEDVAPAIALAGRMITAKRSETAFLPSAAILAKIGTDGRAYVRYQEGFRPGGLAIAGDFVRQFDADRTATFEAGLGVGAEGVGQRQFSASVSRTRWSAIQADFIDEAGLPTTANVGDGTIWTFSARGEVELAPGLRLDAGASFNDSRVDEPDLAALVRITEIPNVARFASRLGAQWSTPLSDDLDLMLEGWASYIGKSRLGVGPELGEIQGGYLDSGALARIDRHGLALTLSVTNIADIEGNRFALGTPFAIGRQQVTPLQPRTVRLGFETRF